MSFDGVILDRQPVSYRSGILVSYLVYRLVQQLLLQQQQQQKQLQQLQQR